jgi:hypothetical protein
MRRTSPKKEGKWTTGRGGEGAMGRAGDDVLISKSSTRPFAPSPTHSIFRRVIAAREYVFQHRTHLHVTVEELEKAVELV